MKELLAKIKESKKLKMIIVIMLCALTAIIYFLPDGSDDRNKNDQTVISNNSEDHSSKEKKLEEVLSNIKGAGRVSVMITYQSSSEVVTASSTETQTSTVIEKSENGGTRESETIVENKAPVTVGSGSGENALVVVEKEPEIKGVIVVAEGAENITVKLSLQKAVETVLQVSPSQVEIFAMN